jgi:hypothetical protein
MGISMMTAPAEGSPASIVLDGEEMKITVNATGQVEIMGVAGVKITALGPLALDAPDITIGGEDTASISLAGATVSVGGPTTASVSVGSPSTAEVSVSGAMVSLGLG